MKTAIKYSAILLLLSISILVQARINVVSPAPDALGRAMQQAKSGDILFLKNGTYKVGIQNVNMEVSKRNITIIGESLDGVVVTGSKVSSSDPNSTNTVFISGSAFYAENVTFENTGSTAQALALRVEGDSAIFNACRVRGYQDAHRANVNRSYYANCEALGSVDFIYGSASVLYDNSKIIARKAGYVTAPENNGKFIFRNCTLTPESGSNVATSSCYLGRPWGSIGVTAVYIECKLGTHINPIGWTTMGSGVPTLFGEYHSMNLDATAADTTQRGNGGQQLTSAQASQYDVVTFFNGWDPRIKTQSALLPAPTGMYVLGDTLYWGAVSGARGYLVYRNDTALVGVDVNKYCLKGNLHQNYTIKTFNQYGRLGVASSVITSVGGKKEDVKIYVANNILYVPENEGVEIYNLLGNKVLSHISGEQILLNDLPKGIYIVRVLLDKKGNYASQKIIIK